MSQWHIKDEHFRRFSRSVSMASGSLCIGLDADPEEAAHPQVLRTPVCSLALIFAGSGELRDASGRHAVAPGSVVLRLPDREQRLRFDPSPRYAKAYCCLPAVCMAPLADLGLIDPRRPVWPCPDPQRGLQAHAGLITRLSAPEPPQGFALWQALCTCFATWAPGSATDDDAIDTACRLLADDLDASWDLRAVAKQVGLDYHRFRRRFRQQLGLAPAAWRLQERMKRAGALLAEMSVQDCAAALGYANPFVFSAQFKRSMGCPPSAWRQAARGG